MSTALLLIDFINPFRYPRAEALLANTRRIVDPVVDLAGRARQAGVPVLYVNDNFGQWRSSFQETAAACRRGPGADVVRALEPAEGDYFVLKPSAPDSTARR